MDTLIVTLMAYDHYFQHPQHKCLNLPRIDHAVPSEINDGLPFL